MQCILYIFTLLPSSLLLTTLSPFHFFLPLLLLPLLSPFFFLHQVQLEFPSYFLIIEFALECGKLTKSHILKIADRISPSSYQLSTALQKVGEFYVHLPLSVWGYFLTGTCAGLVSAVNCECTCVSVLLHLENSFLDVTNKLSALQENHITLLTRRSVHMTGNDFSLHPLTRTSLHPHQRSFSSQ